MNDEQKWFLVPFNPPQEMRDAYSHATMASERFDLESWQAALLAAQQPVKRCKTCKWWDAADTQAPPPYGNAACKSRDFSDDVLAIVTHEGPADDFWTAPEFGCVHWEARGSQE